MTTENWPRKRLIKTVSAQLAFLLQNFSFVFFKFISRVSAACKVLYCACAAADTSSFYCTARLANGTHFCTSYHPSRTPQTSFFLSNLASFFRCFYLFSLWFSSLSELATVWFARFPSSFFFECPREFPRARLTFGRTV